MPDNGLPAGIEIREVGIQRLDEIGLLRARVWAPLIKDLRLVNGHLLDQFDQTARHWAAFSEGKIIASARLCVGGQHELTLGNLIRTNDVDAKWPSAEMMRLVVKEEFRSLGIARAMDRMRIDAARAAGAKAVYGVTSTRTEMLSALGFEPCSPVSAEKFCKVFGYRLPEGEDAILMRLKLAKLCE